MKKKELEMRLARRLVISHLFSSARMKQHIMMTMDSIMKNDKGESPLSPSHHLQYIYKSMCVYDTSELIFMQS